MSKATPTVGIAANASGKLNAIMAVAPAIMEPKKNMNEKITTTGTGKVANCSGSLPITPVSHIPQVKFWEKLFYSI
ncbi:hypothetical protein JCM15765_36620 [Paradesulfitobacterium aromaticivorans]